MVISGWVEQFDAKNNVSNMTLHHTSINETMSWSVDTPFSKGGAESDPSDYKWIYFNLAPKVSSGAYDSGSYATYLCDSAVYRDSEFEQHNVYTHFLDRYLVDLATGGRIMRNIVCVV